MLKSYSDFNGAWEILLFDTEGMQAITLEALKFLISSHAEKDIPVTVSQGGRDSLKELLDKIAVTGDLDRGDQESLYCLVYILSMATGFAYHEKVSIQSAFLNLREKLSPSNSFSLMNSEYRLMSGVFEQAKNEVDIDSVRSYLNECKRHESRLEALNALSLKVEGLEETLKRHEVAYNFVGLYDGFNSMRNQKERELRRQNTYVRLLGFAAVLPFLVKLLDVLFVSGDKVNVPLLITIGGLELIVIYFFRIALHSANSIKAQLLQIDLRRTLCSFIQDYAEYSKKIKESNPAALDKFETLIFSGLVMQDDKLPSTFDGLEPIQKILERRN